MKKSALLALFLLAGCIADGVEPTAVPAEFRVLSAAPSETAAPSGTASGEIGSVVVAGTFVGECTTALTGEARRYNGLLVVDLISTAGGRACDGPAGPWAYEYQAVLTGVEPGLYRVEVLNNGGPFNAPTQTVRVH